MSALHLLWLLPLTFLLWYFSVVPCEGSGMSNLQIITDLCRMLDTAQEVIRQQAELLQLHGITTPTGDLERRRQELLERIERST